MFDRQRRRQYGSCQPALTHLFSGRSTGVAGTYATLPAATEGCSASADARFPPERRLAVPAHLVPPCGPAAHALALCPAVLALFRLQGWAPTLLPRCAVTRVLANARARLAPPRRALAHTIAY